MASFTFPDMLPSPPTTPPPAFASIPAFIPAAIQHFTPALKVKRALDFRVGRSRFLPSRSDSITYSDLEDIFQHIRRAKPRIWRHIESNERWEFDASSQTLHLRMTPTKLHKALVFNIAAGVSEAVEDAARRCPDPTATNVWKSIRSTGSTPVRFGIGGGDSIVPAGGQLFPDKCWMHPASSFPPFVLEVAWSGYPQDLDKKAHDLIEKSQGRVRTVLTVDAVYTKSESAEEEDEETVDASSIKISLYRYCLKDDEFWVDTVYASLPISAAVVALRFADFLPYSQTLQASQKTYQTTDETVGDIVLGPEVFTTAVQKAQVVHRVISEELPEEMGLANLRKRAREDEEF